MLLTTKVSQFSTDSDKVHAWVNGPASGIGSTVTTDAGAVRTPAKLIADMEAAVVVASENLVLFAGAAGAGLVGTVPAGTLSATNVQAALNELATEKAALADLAAPTGSGLVGANAYQTQDEVNLERVSILRYGDNTAPGVTNMTAAYLAAVATGKKVTIPNGLYLINAPVDSGGALHIQIEGETPCYMPDQGIDNIISNTNSSLYTDLPPASLYANFPVIICDGCNFVGAPDSSSVGASSALRSLKNVVLWGKNGAKIGVYTKGTNCQIDNISTVLFERAGIVNRAQILSQITNVTGFDNGWNVAGSGAPGYPNTYTSGANVLVLSNMIAGDYTTVTPAYRPTTLDVKNIWSYVRNHTETTKSGLRGVHIHGLLQGVLANIGGYTGNLYNICTASLDAPYVENYATSGYIAGDATPICSAHLNCVMSIQPGYFANIGGAASPPVVVVDSAVPSIPSYVTQINNGTATPFSRPSAPQLTKQITVGTAGVMQSYTFSNFVRNTAGFVGMLSVSLIKTADYTNYSRALLYVANHRAGGASWQPATSAVISASNSAGVTGVYAATIGATWSGADLVVTVTWGGLWATNTAWQLDIAGFGTGTLGT